MPQFVVNKVLRDHNRDDRVVMAQVNRHPVIRVVIRGAAKDCAICGKKVARGEDAFRPALDSAKGGVQRYMRFCTACIEGREGCDCRKCQGAE